MTDGRILNMLSITVNDKTKQWLETESIKIDRPVTWVIRGIVEQHIIGVIGAKKPRGRPKGAKNKEVKRQEVKRPRGRPRKVDAC